MPDEKFQRFEYTDRFFHLSLPELVEKIMLKFPLVKRKLICQMLAHIANGEPTNTELGLYSKEALEEWIKEKEDGKAL